MNVRLVCLCLVMSAYVHIGIIIIYCAIFSGEKIYAKTNSENVKSPNQQIALPSWSHLAELGDFTEQAEYFVRRTRMTRAQARRGSQLVNGMRHELYKLWQDFKMAQFGSTVSGLAFSTNDIDVVVALADANNTLYKSPELALKAVEVLKNNSYRAIRVRTNTIVSFLQLVHITSKQAVDVSFKKSTLGNTKIIKYMFQIDRRALHLMIIIKFWANNNKLKIRRVMPSVVWYLLVLFYLQQVKVLPSVHILQKFAKPKYLNHWNFAFEEPYEYLYPSEINSSLYELLGDFFTYYARFDFQKFCISVFAGIPIPRKLFKSDKTVPDVLELYKHNIKYNNTQNLNVKSSLCVQEIFIHNDNVAGNVKLKLLEQLQNKSQQAAQIFRTHNRINFLSSLLTMK